MLNIKQKILGFSNSYNYYKKYYEKTVNDIKIEKELCDNLKTLISKQEKYNEDISLTKKEINSKWDNFIKSMDNKMDSMSMDNKTKKFFNDYIDREKKLIDENVYLKNINGINLKHYLTARMDIKNYGNKENEIEFLSISDENIFLSYPGWFNNKEGKGAFIQSSKSSIDFKLKCIKDGSLEITLRGVDARNHLNKDIRIPIFINFTSLRINGIEQIKKSELVSHDTPRNYKIPIKDGDIVYVHAEWSPYQWAV